MSQQWKAQESPWIHGLWQVVTERDIIADDLERDEAPLIAAAPDLLAALEAVEWVQMYAPHSDGTPCRAGFTCPWCLSCLDRGHAADCQRQAALQKARGE